MNNQPIQTLKFSLHTPPLVSIPLPFFLHDDAWSDARILQVARYIYWHIMYASLIFSAINF